MVHEKQHLFESSPGRILRNEVRENSSRRWGEVRAEAEFTIEGERYGKGR